MLRHTAPLLLSTLLSACAADSGDTSEGGDTSASSGASDTSDTTTGAAADPYACVETMRMEFAPLAGPGWDPAGGLLPPLQDTYIVHTTQILVKPEGIARFGELVGQISAQLQATDGLVAYVTAQDMNCGWARTLGIWRSEAAMYGFVASGAHLTAMAETTDISFTGKVTHWTVDADALPVGWQEAEARLAAVAPSPLYE